MAYSKDERKKHSKPGLTPEQAKRKKKAVEQRKREADRKKAKATSDYNREAEKAAKAKRARELRERTSKGRKKVPGWSAMPANEIILKPSTAYKNIDKQHKKDLTGPLKINNPKRKKKK